MKKGDAILLTKLTDDEFNGLHPNGIYAGYSMLGVFPGNPVLMERYTIPGKHMHDWLKTSIVTSILEDTEDFLIFKTRNSTYKIEKYNFVPNEDIEVNI